MKNDQQDLSNQLLFISEKSISDEKSLVEELIKFLGNNQYDHNQLEAVAVSYIESARKSKNSKTISDFFHEYNFKSKEGLSIMALAESLLRIPDNKTANELIEDKLQGTNWSKHMGRDKSSLINASAMGLSLAERLFSFSSVLKTLSDPIIREAIKKSIMYLSDHFVLAENIESALSKAKEYEDKGYLFSYDMLGEGARNYIEAEEYFQNYLALINAFKDSTDKRSRYVSIKLSALHPRFEWLKKEQVIAELIPVLKELILAAKELDVSITFDAEESARFDLYLLIFTTLLNDPVTDNYNSLGLAIQAYQKRAFSAIKLLKNLTKKLEKKIHIRLVKGAYFDYEIKQAQIEGLTNYPVFTSKAHTDISYLACALAMLAENEFIYPQFATHNAHTIACIQKFGENKKYELQLLFGMGFAIYEKIVKQKTARCRIYAPIGKYKELLPYLIRRLLENGSSNNFVKLFADNNIAINLLVEDPVKAAQNTLWPKFGLPNKIYDFWDNASGIDLSNRFALDKTYNLLGKFSSKQYNAYSIINGTKHISKTSVFIPIYKPYNQKEQVGNLVYINQDEVFLSIINAKQGFSDWEEVVLNKRCQIILNVAKELENNFYELVSLLIKEAGKTLKDAVNEVREAIDYCRYYVLQANLILNKEYNLPSVTGETNQMKFYAKGIFVCISPWNFPLAIFTGQIVAALVTGNSVIAKPASQTPLIATYIVELMHKAGVPVNALNLLQIKGKDLNEYLLSDPNIAGVVFTGSTETALDINRTLSKRYSALPTIIAETGGINTMIIDSTALIDQTVDYIITSSFNSAGQRCSSCRVVYIQEEIYEKLIATLSAAISALRINNPEYLSSDIGPLINNEAKNKIITYIKKIQKTCKIIVGANENEQDEQFINNNFIHPYIIDINSIKDLSEEVFGPVLHVVKYKSEDLDKIITEINESNYGLTLGIISRIKCKADYISSKVKVGNIYINRNMIGAVVGTQPFGGENLSGTGFKAGGRNYLLKFLTERVITENTTSIGGDLELIL